MATFSIPFVTDNPTSWGPLPLDDNEQQQQQQNAPGNLARFAQLPFRPFGRSDRLGRAADFTARFRTTTETESAEPTADFMLVDTTKAAPKRFVNPANKRRQHNQRLRQINARRQGAQSGKNGTVLLSHSYSGRGGGGGRGPARGGGGGGRYGGRGGRGGGGRYGGRGGRGYYDRGNRVDRPPSVAVQDDWIKCEELDLAKVAKNLTPVNVPVAEDVLWCGFLDAYNESYDKVTARQPVPLKKMNKKLFYPVTTTDDPVLEKLAIDGVGNVFFTDAILAHLMTCTRSVYPWDVVIQKLPNGTLFFDKRDNSQFDYLSVHETAYSPPSDEEGINSASRLSLEATTVCHNFSQQILKKKERQNMPLPHPFYDQEDDPSMEPASVAYRYRKWKVDDNVTLVCRTELHATVKKTQKITCFALNEYAPSASSNNNNHHNVIHWRDKIDAQRGAVMATELKANSFKVAKWTAQSLLAGADQMKIGFVSRSAPKVAHEHVLLATQFYRPQAFAQQITLHEGRIWAMLKTFVNLVSKQDSPGKYVLMRDPNKPVVRLYKVPAETFESDEE